MLAFVCGCVIWTVREGGSVAVCMCLCGVSNDGFFVYVCILNVSCLCVCVCARFGQSIRGYVSVFIHLYVLVCPCDCVIPLVSAFAGLCMFCVSVYLKGLVT